MGNPVPATFSHPGPVPVTVKYWLYFILIFLNVKMQQFLFYSAEKPFYTKLQINFTSELFLESINTHIFG